MIILVIAIAIIFYSFYFVYHVFKGTTGPQVHEENKRLKAENERLRNK
jgi:uncharacterized protein YxeA